MMGLDAFRETLRDPRLQDILLIFETPGYFRGNRPNGSVLGAWVAEIEHDRHLAEEAFLRQIVSLDDEHGRRRSGLVYCGGGM